jgi:hypothetical protein
MDPFAQLAKVFGKVGIAAGAEYIETICQLCRRECLYSQI